MVRKIVTHHTHVVNKEAPHNTSSCEGPFRKSEVLQEQKADNARTQNEERILII